jgi:hypothetical protein
MLTKEWQRKKEKNEPPPSSCFLICIQSEAKDAHKQRIFIQHHEPYLG